MGITLDAVKNHHWLVQKKFPNHTLVMTSLIGSNNYNLDTPASDIDTVTFFFPTFEELATGQGMTAGEFEVDDGKCAYKDIRLALNLLKSTSPNSIEYFTSHYIYIEPTFEDTMNLRLKNPEILFYLTHCNYWHMICAISGMAYQMLVNKNMPMGKRYSHVLRMKDMYEVFLDNSMTKDLLKMKLDDYLKAKSAKFYDDESRYDAYLNSMTKISEYFWDCRNSFVHTKEMKEVEEIGKFQVEKLQKELFDLYLRKILFDVC